MRLKTQRKAYARSHVLVAFHVVISVRVAVVKNAHVIAKSKFPINVSVVTLIPEHAVRQKHASALRSAV